MSTIITDEIMKERLAQSKDYSVIILRKTEKMKDPEAMKVIWEHGRRNFQLREEGLLSIVCPIRDESDVAGIGIFNTNSEAVKKIYEEDPAVREGYLTFEVHPCKAFPGDRLP